MNFSNTKEPAGQKGGKSRGAEKRLRILAAAEEIMSEKGLAESSISEIAARAGVADSVIYQYFKGKQDLLFAIPAGRMEDVLKLLNEHLQGIESAESRLRKMIWFHLRFNDTHQGYARLLLLECRSSGDFYKTRAHELIRRYAGILSSIVSRGIETGAFRQGLNIRLVREIILGALDMECVASLASGEIEKGEQDFEAIVSLVLAMIAPKPSAEETGGAKRDAIMNAAEKVFAEKGFNGAKISEIARLAGVADGTIYEYFSNKEDVLFSLSMNRFDRYLSGVSDVFSIKSPLRKVRRLIKFHFSSFMNERDFLKVFLLHLQLNRRFYGSEAFEGFKRYYGLVESLVEEGKQAGVFRPEVNARVFRNMFFGVFSHMALRWLIVTEWPDTDKMKEIEEVTDLLAAAIVTPERAR